MLVDRKKLKNIDRHQLANYLGISYTTLWRKLYKGYEFTESEIEKINSLLGEE